MKIRFRLAKSRSRVAAPARINASFTSSDGWKEMGPTEIQFLAPKMRSPITTLKASSAAASPAAGHRSFTASCSRPSNHPSTQ